MNNRIWLYDFHLFDGEGAGAEASTAGSEQTEQKPVVEYGKSRGEGAANSQVGTDRASEGNSPEAEFAALVGKGGKYHDVYGQMVSNVIQDRFKNQRDLQGQVDEYNDGLTPLYMNYGLDIGDFEGLRNAIANDDAFFQAQAERAGLDVDQYRENLRLKAEAERGRQISEAYQEQQRRNAMAAQWESEAEVLREAFPNFDLGLEYQYNEEFRKLIENGVSVQKAFLTAHSAEIFAGANAHAETVATQNVLNTIHQRASRPAEGAMRPGAAIVRKSDPSSLSNEDIDEINRRVAMGESISF